MPPKTRRLLLVALLALALLPFLLVKTKYAETVEELQSQQGSLPIGIRPVDEAEAKRAEEQAVQNKKSLKLQKLKNKPAAQQESG